MTGSHDTYIGRMETFRIYFVDPSKQQPTHQKLSESEFFEVLKTLTQEEINDGELEERE